MIIRPIKRKPKECPLCKGKDFKEYSSTKIPMENNPHKHEQLDQWFECQNCHIRLGA